MITRITFSHWFMLNMAMLLAVACNREDQPKPDMQEIPSAITFEEAHDWFTGHAEDVSITDLANGRVAKNIKREPLWKWAENLRLTNGTLVVSVPLLYEKGHGLGRGGLTKLIFFKDKQGQIQMRILKAISDASYLLNKNGKFSMADFSGVLIMEDWNENFLNGVRYAKGKIIGELSPAQSSKAGRVSGVCQEVRIEYYVDVCIGGNCGGQRLDFVKTYYVCSGGSGNSGGISSGNTGQAVGGGGGDIYSGIVPDKEESNRADGEGRTTVVRDHAERLIIPGYGNPSISLKSYLDCFGSNQSSQNTYTITVYVEEPVPGSGINSSISGNVGHTCIALSKGTGNSTITQVIGFYPEKGWKAVMPPFPAVTSEMHDNGIDTRYTVSVSYEVSNEGFQNAINAALAYSSNHYDIANNNCTNYVLDICNSAGIAIPQTKGDLIYTSGYHPGQLGLDLRMLKQNNPNANVNTQGGYTPASKGPC
jgi:hypothetical protein